MWTYCIRGPSQRRKRITIRITIKIMIRFIEKGGAVMVLSERWGVEASRSSPAGRKMDINSSKRLDRDDD